MKPKRIQIAYGGSHRKNARCLNLLRPFLASGGGFCRYQSKIVEAIVYDTPELRAVLKQCGGSVCRQQPSWLNENRTP